MQTLVNYAADPQHHVHALAAADLHTGELLTPPSPALTVRHPVYSLTKSLLSLGVGSLKHTGRLDIHKPLADYLTAEQLALVPQSSRSAFCQLPVTRFLTMSLAGYPFRPEGEQDWIAQALGAEIDYTQPPTFAYSNFPALLVGIAAQNAADEPFADYLYRHVLEPANVSPAPCKLTPEGYFYGASGMELSVQEIVQIGCCIPEEGSFSEAVRFQISTETGGYGYFFRVENDCWYMSGKWGQKCIAFPRTGRLVAYLCDRPEGDRELFDLALAFGRDRFFL